MTDWPSSRPTIQLTNKPTAGQTSVLIEKLHPAIFTSPYDIAQFLFRNVFYLEFKYFDMYKNKNSEKRTTEKAGLELI